MQTLHTCKAVVITCIDFRFQDFIDQWLEKHFTPRDFDRVALGGGVKNLGVILSQIKISHDMHHIEKVILINHENCGAYAEADTPEKHAHDLLETKTKIKELYPDLDIETYYLHLDGEFEPVSLSESQWLETAPSLQASGQNISI
ncbi:hypothetical protein A2631_03430 [Candidatus Daviesbacteria bacterium RIFCSPHIGHO2_01_FULL_44_29]|uniref:Carbonic anhydrase n=1 Tax=Candidatus Daviesbacteria bacterium RIFCSPHIGHO2_02_FULL_43_12 TaxID=1797776 RepID=A0A1F5KFN4_9BACT|nr:MAG: hypothetical protein A2631_03430 [Candidatus Daviesbacteria bacterium RIFCSPHIGHO2_01_FULL_44_29]OGE38850.1 MAG: hypothetical protein A3E86_02955 [Candidatus Daviesbacteria bacterium RIFCSPHIGHO2_12_FULL_47_45]OGE39747.1 MAG: hypothetical protein A3D25_03395 [Candidatus Daviesbacteria bacterium RIFCSPHIGHO2_02_FULL_43_12]OGE69962.1 MAG: hypothetical protein A3B55_04695 [Candidatus Daviesbacteria bacterium RIFCSPLOWO2_01_FULL_43_15]